MVARQSGSLRRRKRRLIEDEDDDEDEDDSKFGIWAKAWGGAKRNPGNRLKSGRALKARKDMLCKGRPRTSSLCTFLGHAAPDRAGARPLSIRNVL